MDPTHSAARMMAEMLGQPIFATDLFLPSYRSDEEGLWQVKLSGPLTDRGYWGTQYLSENMPVLMRRGDDGQWETWMSLSAFELESQELAVRNAHGHTVIMGLGMGWAAVNAALNPACRKVTVVERDPQVRELIQRGGIVEQLPAEAAAKITIEAADALEWTPREPVDLLYPDIWLYIAEPDTLPDTLRMQANVQAESVYMWGQELVLERLAREANGGEEVDKAQLLAAAESIGLPLLLPGENYPTLALTAARSYRLRNPSRFPIPPIP